MILEVTIDRMFLLSKKILEIKSYNNSEWGACTWENCSLRKWLNSEFIEATFSSEEQSKIQTTSVSADKNPKYNTNPGNTTVDKVFILSINEFNKYKISGDKAICYWLRSPGDVQYVTAFVNHEGSVDADGILASANYGVRPVLWIGF